MLSKELTRTSVLIHRRLRNCQLMVTRARAMNGFRQSLAHKGLFRNSYLTMGGAFTVTGIATLMIYLIFKLRDQYLKGTCEEAIIHNVSNGACVRQSEEVLQADLVYIARVKVDVSSTHHNSDARQEGKVTFDLGGGANADNTVSSAKLFYGVKLSPRCFTIDETTLALSKS